LRLLLLQDHHYLPSFGGGVKANRLLLERLAARGHACASISRAFEANVGPSDEPSFRAEFGRRGIAVSAPSRHVLAYRHAGVGVEAVDFPTAEGLRAHVERRVSELRPDWILVNDDRQRTLLPAALAADPAHRVVSLLQTVAALPFGPLAAAPSAAQSELLRAVRSRVVISRFLQSYVEHHGGMSATLLRLPVYGSGPFPALGRFDRGCVTLVNPCLEKGVDVFLALARRLPDVAFAAVPAWGTGPDVRAALEREPNVRLLAAADDIGTILARTRVLLVPSLWPETFGYVVPEALLRGIPVLASDVGGLREASLGVATVLPVGELVRRNGRYAAPAQDVEPWLTALRGLLTNRAEYERRAREGREAAHAFVARIDPDAFERDLRRLEAEER
jgi:glycosyltransferase involved in cell wall biosynthesis